MKNRDRHLYLLHIPSLPSQHTSLQTLARTQKSLWPRGSFCGFTAELIVWKDQCIQLAVKKNEISNWKWRGKNGEETPFLLSACEEKTYQPCLKGEPQFPGESRCILFCILLEVSARKKESPSSARPLISAMTRIPAVTSMDGATGAFLKACLIFQTRLIPPVSSLCIKCVTKEEAAAWGFVCCRWGQSRLKTVGNLNLVPVHSDVKPREMKAESGDLWKKWQEPLLCVQYWLKKIVLPPNWNGFYVFGPILTKTLFSLLMRPCCHGDAGLDAWQKHVLIRQV